MQKSQKAEVLDFVRNMHQAHDEVRDALERKEIPVIQNMLCDCQELAIALGNLIEELEGEGFVTVSYIEQYCEVLYHILIKIWQGNFNPHKIHKQLKKYTLRIENSIRSDITARKEVVFFPYKASMWDSLESLYLKYREAPDTDVLCVPIPYYEMNPDGTFGRMHYEGGEYPENIDITDWESYSFEKSHPDEIYIHNAYDNWNLVTSVHPRFYSDKLKKHTDKLVYVPYFVMGDIDIDQPGVAESKKHFCFLPGIIHADQVILESEAVKRLYVSEYLKAAKKQGLAGEHVNIDRLNQKFVGAGSPKYDKVKYTKSEDIEIPKEWLKIIEKPDGSRKKIILYNTGIAALLEHGEKWVEKIAYALDIFRKHCDEVALLWRPHPLIEETMKTMRPQVLQRYTELKLQYRQEGWGIYDDTADLDRAVVLSDAYYGDRSSVVQLFHTLGKVAIIPDDSVLRIHGHITIGNNLWFTCLNFNGIFCYSYENDIVECIKKFPIIGKDISYVYHLAFYYEEKILFIPRMNNPIYLFDLRSREIKEIMLEKPGKYNIGKFLAATKIDSKVYLLPFNYPALVEYDFASDVIVEHSHVVDHIVADKSMVRTKLCMTGDIIGDILWLGMYMEPRCYIVSLRDFSVSEISIPEITTGIRSINGFGNRIYIGLGNGSLIVYYNGKVDVIDTGLKEIEYAYICENSLLMINRYEQRMLKLDCVKGIIHELDYTNLGNPCIPYISRDANILDFSYSVGDVSLKRYDLLRNRFHTLNIELNDVKSVFNLF